MKGKFLAENKFSFVSCSVTPDMSLTLANDVVSLKRTFKDCIVRFWTQHEGISYVWPISCFSFGFIYFLINSGCVPIFMTMGYTFFQIRVDLHSWVRVSFNIRDDDGGNVKILSKT